MIFTAWSYNKFEVQLNKETDEVQLNWYIQNTAWDIVHTSVSESRGDESSVSYILTLKRKSAFYMFNVILPMLLLSVLNIFAFFLPTSSGERASYAMTMFLSLAIFMTIISSELPKNSVKTSLLAVYLTILSCLSTLIVVLCLVQLRLASRDTLTKPINVFFMSFIKITDFFTCKKCRTYAKRSVTPASKLSQHSLWTESDVATERSWVDVVDAMDFVFFWSTVVCTVVSTLVLFVATANSGTH